MNGKIKILLIVGGTLLAFGASLCALSAAMGFRGQFGITTGFKYVDFLDGSDVSRLEKTQTEAFSDISADMLPCDIELIPSDGYYIEYSLYSAAGFSCYADNGTLYIKNGSADGSRNYLLSFGRFPFLFNIGSSNINTGYLKIYYPENTVFGNLQLGNSVGNIKISGLTCKNLNISASAGDLRLNRINAEAGSIKCSLGDIHISDLSGGNAVIISHAGDTKLENAELDGKLTIENNLGDIKARGATASAIDISNDCGDIEAKGFSADNILIDANLGDVELETAYDGNDYNYDLHTSLGEVEFKNQNHGSRAVINSGALRSITIKNDCGDIEVR